MNRGLRLAAATTLVAAAGLTGSTPAYAEPCSTDTGVTVVVDFHELGGGLQQVCDAGGGGQRASTLFPDNGFPLTYVQRQPGFVCRVSGAPADDPCVNTPPADAYWGLWWSDGETGTWSYSSAGAASLTIPAGGSVAFSWNGSSTKSPPGAPPPEHATEEPSEDPEPTHEPTTRPGEPPASGGGSSHASGSPSASPTTSTPSGTGDRRGRPDHDPEAPDRDRDRRDAGGRERAADEPSEESRATLSVSAPSAAEPPASGDDPALPVWVGPTAVAALLVAAGGATYLRRRAS